MKKLLKIITVSIVLVCLLYFFRFEITYFRTIDKIKVDQNRKIWGKPSFVVIQRDNFVDIYKKNPSNKYVFIFSKKDSILEKKWKEN